MIISTGVARLRKRLSDIVTPQNRALGLMIAGIATVVVSLFAWQPVVAGVTAGVAAIVYSLVFIDLDSEKSVRRRR